MPKLTGYITAVRTYIANRTKPVPPPVDPRVAKLYKLGITAPAATIEACQRTGLPVALAASVLTQESGGGHNVWGHDPTIFAGGPTGDNRPVTKTDYLAYKAKRVASGNRLMQGVGPMQLTYWSIQDQADAAGGCWDPLANMQTGFSHLAAAVHRAGLRNAVVAYNGSGPAAEHYADTVLARMAEYEKELT